MIWLVASRTRVISVQPDVLPKSYPSVFFYQAQDVIELDAGQAPVHGHHGVDHVVKLEMPAS